MSAPAASPSSNSPLPPVVSTPPSPAVGATPPLPVSVPPPVPVVSSPPPVSPSPPPPTPVSPPPAAPPPPIVNVPIPPVINPSPPPPPVVNPSPPPPSPVLPPPVTSTSPPPSISPPPPTLTPSPPAPVASSPPPPVEQTPSPPSPVNAPPPKDSASPAPPDEAVSPSPSKKRSPPPPSRKFAPPPQVEPTVQPPPAPSPPGVPGVPVALSPPPLSPVVNNTTPSSTDTPSDVSLSPPGTFISTDKSSSVSSSAIVGIAIGGVALLAILALVVVCFSRKNKRGGGNYGPSQDFRTAASFYNKEDGYYDPGRGRFDSGYSTASDATGRPFFPSRPPPPTLGHAPTQGSSNSSNFSYEVLAQATNGFSKVNKLGEGGFGCVYKGILPGGQEVAVKQLKVGGGQGEREFRAEVEIITRIHHRHLVTLVGYCISETQRLLVYEYVPNDTLEHHLHGKGKGKALLDWSLRVKIAIGAARGLAYLHEDCHPKIIHRDIKSSNILLDSNFEAQVADFGLAKLASDTHTHVTTRVMGTFGYLAPEYASSGKLTDKSDIYSFGVVLLELVTGRKPVDTSQPLGEESLVEWARPLLTQALEMETIDVLADPSLTDCDKDEMLRMARAAAACIRHSANKRPKMSQIVRALENDSNTGFTGIHDSPFASEDYDSVQYSSDLRRFKKMALGTSQEYGSEYSGATSEYGVNPSVSSGEFPSKDWTGKNGRESEWPLRSRQM